MFEHLIGPLSPRMVPVVDPDYHHEKARGLAKVKIPHVRSIEYGSQNRTMKCW